MEPFSRRDFLKTATMSLALLAGDAWILDPFRKAWAESPAGLNEFLVLCDTPKEVTRIATGVTVTNPGSVRFLEVSSGESYAVDVPFFGHTVTQNPKHLHQLVMFEKWGRRGALIDLKERSLVTAVETSEGNLFFGHAAFVSGGSVLVTTEDSYERNKGGLVLRDPASLKIIETYSSYGIKPHECRVAADGRTIMVVNGSNDKSPSSVAWVEMSSGKLLHKVMLDAEPNTNFGHMDISYDGWICAGGSAAPMRPSVAFVSPEGRVTQPDIPEDLMAKMTGEGLSIAVLGKSGLVAVTVPDADRILVLDYKTRAFAGSVKVFKGNGVLPDLKMQGEEPSLLVSSATYKNLMEVKFRPGRNVSDTAILSASFGGNGSHLARIYA